METNQDKKGLWSQLPKWGKVLAIVIPLGLIGNLISNDSGSSNEVKATPNTWAEMDSIQKIEWMGKMSERQDVPSIAVTIEEKIKEQVKYPEELDFGFLGLVGSVKDGQPINGKPILQYVGTATTKNGFGVKVSLNWIAEAEILPESQTVKTVLVFEK